MIEKLKDKLMRKMKENEEEKHKYEGRIADLEQRLQSGEQNEQFNSIYKEKYE